MDIGNIVRLDTVLRFDNWCELLPSTDDSIPRCKSQMSTEETVQPFRCLHSDSSREDTSVPTNDCTINSLMRQSECLRSEKWQELATLDCSKRNTMLNSSIIPLEWCGLSQFRGVKFHCCVLKGKRRRTRAREKKYEDRLETNLDLDVKNDYETNLNEDDPIEELLILPKTTSTEGTHRKIIAMSLGLRKMPPIESLISYRFSLIFSGEPTWMEDYRRWSADTGYFAGRTRNCLELRRRKTPNVHCHLDDEDTSDDQEEIKLTSTRKSHLTIKEHDRFSKEKANFQKKYNQQIEQVSERMSSFSFFR